MDVSGAWSEFKTGKWQEEIDVRDFIQSNYTPYEGDASFLSGPTDQTLRLWKEIEDKFPVEIEKGIYDVDTKTPASITAFGPGYISSEDNIVVGLQTDEPLKCAMMPNGGWRMVESSLEMYGKTPDPTLAKIFTDYRKTHNAAVFEAYTPEIRAARSSHLITGLPDAYGRGRIIGDYRRVALYGVDFLIKSKKQDKASRDKDSFSEELMRFREEQSEQIKALNELKLMAASYGYDISLPAKNAQEAVQWLYFGYLGAIKEQDGAAMSLGRTSTFLDIYFERDLRNGILGETQAQEIIDNFVIKLRMVRFLRPQAYHELYAGLPTWTTESMAGMGEDGRPLVTKGTFRFLQTLRNLGPSPEPNMTIFWSDKLPQGFKDFASALSIETSAIQYESDDYIRQYWGDDAAIACCVSPMRVGKQMQFFGARVNGVKALLYAINEGRDEVTGKLVAQGILPLKSKEVLDFDEVWERFETMLGWLARVYVEALNIIHYMHDKYAYERLEMALHDKEVFRTLACGLAGLSLVADSLSAIKYAKVRPVYDSNGLAESYQIEGESPFFGNDDDRVDELAVKISETFMAKLREQKTYRDAVPTSSILTITANVTYGKNTKGDPSGREAFTPFAPGANPMNGRDTHGLLASVMSVAKLPYAASQDGISLTSSMIPGALGRTKEDQIKSLSGVLDASFISGLYHMNVNVMNKETLLEALDHPEKYPSLCVRVSGYAVLFNRLTREQKLDVISRTSHTSI